MLWKNYNSSEELFAKVKDAISCVLRIRADQFILWLLEAGKWDVLFYYLQAWYRIV